MNESCGTTLRVDGLVRVNLADKAPGQVDRSRLGQPYPSGEEARPRVTEQDSKATRAEVGRGQRGRRAAE